MLCFYIAIRLQAATSAGPALRNLGRRQITAQKNSKLLEAGIAANFYLLFHDRSVLLGYHSLVEPATAVGRRLQRHCAAAFKVGLTARSWKKNLRKTLSNRVLVHGSFSPPCAFARSV